MLRRSKMPYTPNRAPKVKCASYNVSKNKALQQKLDATDREHLHAELISGNIALTFSTAAFEAYREVLRQIINNNLYKEDDIRFESECRTSKDGSSTAEESVIVYQQNVKVYRINLYLTTSVSTVNGKNIRLFSNEHFRYIANLMNKMGDFSKITLLLKISYQPYCQKIQKHLVRMNI